MAMKLIRTEHGYSFLSQYASSKLFSLIGNEDCGVEIMCRACETGGASIAQFNGYSEILPILQAVMAHYQEKHQ